MEEAVWYIYEYVPGGWGARSKRETEREAGLESRRELEGLARRLGGKPLSVLWF